MDEKNEYQTEREANINYIRHALQKLANGQMDYFARRVQVECENAFDRSQRNRFKLGVGNDRKTNGIYIVQNIGYLPNYPLSKLASEMMARIDDNNLWKLYDRPRWQEVM